MTNKSEKKSLDRIFDALSSQHRREIIYALSLQPYSISHLALMRHLSLPAIHKHIDILEKTRFVIRRKSGKTNYLSLNREPLINLKNWVLDFNPQWGSSEETLENYVKFLKREEISVNISNKMTKEGGEKK